MIVPGAAPASTQANSASATTAALVRAGDPGRALELDPDQRHRGADRREDLGMLGRDEPLLVAPAELGDEHLARPAERDDRCVGGDAGGADRLADGHLDLIDRGVERGAGHHGAVAPVPLAERRERGQRRIREPAGERRAGTTSSALAAQVAVTANSPPGPATIA